MSHLAVWLNTAPTILPQILLQVVFPPIPLHTTSLQLAQQHQAQPDVCTQAHTHRNMITWDRPHSSSSQGGSGIGNGTKR